MPAIVLGDYAVIPAWVVDQASFRRWAKSNEYPECGQFAYLKDRVWVDVDMEGNTHNYLKSIIAIVLGGLALQRNLGRYFTDGMLLSNTAAGVSNEPDGMFVSWDAFRDGRARISREDAADDGIEVEGTPDMVLEVVSPSSVRKDTEELLGLYAQAGIPEYWLVNPLAKPLRFDIYHPTVRGYRAVRPQGGWRKSAVFGVGVRLVQTIDPLGHPAYALETR